MISRETRRQIFELQSDVLAAMNSQGWNIPDEGVLDDTQLRSALRSAAIGPVLRQSTTSPRGRG